MTLVPFAMVLFRDGLLLIGAGAALSVLFAALWTQRSGKG